MDRKKYVFTLAMIVIIIAAYLIMKQMSNGDWPSSDYAYSETQGGTEGTTQAPSGENATDNGAGTSDDSSANGDAGNTNTGASDNIGVSDNTGSSDNTDTPDTVTPAQDYVEYRFRNNKLLTQHYEKHGIEMGFDSKEAYEKAASDVVNNPAALHKTEKEDGDFVYYVEATNEFVIVSTDGYIRTYFLPNAGLDYYNRQ